MKRYPVYRDSGLAFVGKIPQHWEAKRAKYCFYEVDERSETGDEELLSVSHITGVTPRSEKNITMFMAESYEGYKTCIPNDLVINIMWAWMGALGVSKYQGIISSAYGVYRPKDTNKFYSDYLEYLVRIPEYIAEYTRTSKGIRSSRLRMYSDDFFQIPIICPLFEEQKTIARFLDRKLEQISHFISNKQRLIELLKEQKTAIINRAVTKGINPHAPMKPSAIEWLGEIPAHWQQIKIKYVLHQIIDTEHKTAPFYEDGQYLVVRTSNIKGGMLDFTNAKYTNLDGFLEWTRRGKPKLGDILFTREAPAGEACLVPQGIDLCLGQRVVLFRVNHQKLNEEFGVYSIYGGIAAEFITLLSQGATVPHFNMSDIANIPLLLPSVNEQQQIVQYIKTETSKIDEVIAKAEKEIELIQEYRTTLISDAVTGKIDVRETSAVESTLTAAAI
ncbi:MULTISPECIES: restriction endonuclease subunit S [Nostoc]|uniref:Restriction endonuclease subunit S n=2 Tax=Nostoc TaxID=1177 RepID=A0ABR8IJB8_9NOSO|nr:MULTISPECIES: restriction endonuclease subunit S [Nostoc]MBD2565243.1 restriction endonuclease subunit S [Nostoc linckia FACHB-391]MBD2650906.1 restriction endonuclease subunit S [Nostoc foliaceum FACHB-393]